MKTGVIIAIIAMAAVLIYFIIDFLAPGSPSWLVFIAAGIGIVAVGGVLGKNGGL